MELPKKNTDIGKGCYILTTSNDLCLVEIVGRTGKVRYLNVCSVDRYFNIDGGYKKTIKSTDIEDWDKDPQKLKMRHIELWL